jgi:RHS repeat-associated protein
VKAVVLALALTLSWTHAVLADGLSRYRVTFRSETIEDEDAFVAGLLAMCRCRLEPYAEMGFAGMMVRATPAAARMLSSNPHVLRVEEVPTESAGPSAEPSPPSAATVAPPPPSAVAAFSPSPPRGPAAEGYTVWNSGNYGYDGAGNIATIDPKSYIYDKAGRLKSGGLTGGGHRQSYDYDRNGNIVKITTTGPSVGHVRTLAVSTDTNRVTSMTVEDSAGPVVHVPVYDDRGRMKSFPGGSFEYDAADMIVESQIGTLRAVHLYNASDERIATIAVNASNVQQGSDWTIRGLSGQVLRRFKQSSPTAPLTWDEDYIYLDGKLLAAEVSTPERTLHFHLDHLGTPRLITGHGGAEVSRRDFHPFGEETVVEDVERMKFTGHERDTKSLDYMHARYYAPEWGRFLSVDPGKDWDLRQPQSWNMYSYVRNNPMNRVDPTGRCGEKPDFIGPTVPCAKAEETPKPQQQPQQAGGRTPARGGQPGTTTEFPAEGGGKTVRTYGPDGRATTDVDHGHDHGAGDPHVHDWDWDKKRPRQPGRAPNPGEIPDPAKSATVGQRRPDLETIIGATILSIGGTAMMIMTGGAMTSQPNAAGVVIFPQSGIAPPNQSDCPPATPYCT